MAFALGKRKQNKNFEAAMIIFVDIDETICVTPGNSSEARNYCLAKPILKNIAAVNQYYDNGHTIVYWTARGASTGIDWTEVTRAQLDKWGCKYNDLKLDKPHYDIYIDDKSINTKRWESLGRCLPELS